MNRYFSLLSIQFSITSVVGCRSFGQQLEESGFYLLRDHSGGPLGALVPSVQRTRILPAKGHLCKGTDH